jgi:hypothetical protein
MPARILLSRVHQTGAETARRRSRRRHAGAAITATVRSGHSKATNRGRPDVHSSLPLRGEQRGCARNSYQSLWIDWESAAWLPPAPHRIGAEGRTAKCWMIRRHALTTSAECLGCVKTRRRRRAIEKTFGQITIKDTKIRKPGRVLVDLRNIVLTTFQIFAFSRRLGHERSCGV